MADRYGYPSPPPGYSDYHYYHHGGYPYPPPPPPPEPYAPSYPINPIDNCIKPAYHWVSTSAHRGVPSTAIHGGVDIDGHQIYVGRAYFNGDWIPAKVIPGKRVAYVAYNGSEHAVNQFEVLCEQRFDWVRSHNGHVPPGAVEGGRTREGEPLYIGRVFHSGSKTVGKVHPSHKTCYIPFGGKEIGHRDYEILVLRS